MNDHPKEPWVPMKKPEPSLTDHGWRAMAMCGDWMVAVRYEVACVIEGGIVKKTWNNEAIARRIVACVNACAGIPDEKLRSWLNPPEGQLGAPHGTWSQQLFVAGEQLVNLQRKHDELLNILKDIQDGAAYTVEFCQRIDAAIAKADTKSCEVCGEH